MNAGRLRRRASDLLDAGARSRSRRPGPARPGRPDGRVRRGRAGTVRAGIEPVPAPCWTVRAWPGDRRARLVAAGAAAHARRRRRRRPGRLRDGLALLDGSPEPRAARCSTGAACTSSAATPARQSPTSPRQSTCSSDADAPERGQAPSTTSATRACSPATWSARCRRWTPPVPCWRPSHRDRAVGEQDRAEVLMAAGRASEAIAALERAATAYGDHGACACQAECELTLAGTLLRDDPAGRGRWRGGPRGGSVRQGSEVQALRADAVAVARRDRRGQVVPGAADDAPTSCRAALQARQHRREAACSSCRPPGWPCAEASSPTPATGRTGSAYRGLPRRHSPALARGPGRARAARAATVATRATTSGPGSPTCTTGSRRSAASTCRAPWSGTAGPWLCRGCARARGRLAGARLRVVASEPARWSRRVTPVRPPADERLAARPHRAARAARRRPVAALGRGPPSRRAARPDPPAELVRRGRWRGRRAGRPDEVRAELAATARAWSRTWSSTAWLTALVVTGTRRAHRAAVRGRSGRLPRPDRRRPRHGGLARWPDRSRRRSAARSTSGSGSSPSAPGPLLPLIGDRRVVLTPVGAPGRHAVVAAARARRPPAHRAAIGDPLAGAAPERGRGRPGRLGRRTRRRRAPRKRSPGPPRRGRGATVLTGDRAAARGHRAGRQGRRAAPRGHGRHPGDNPLFSALELADGPWFGYDIDQLPHTPSTVMLSSCELGRASVRSGDEASG